MKREARSSKSITAPWEFLGFVFKVAGEGRKEERKQGNTGLLYKVQMHLVAEISSLLFCTNSDSREFFSSRVLLLCVNTDHLNYLTWNFSTIALAQRPIKRN